jgi:multidrug resistance efflux pump
MNNKAVLHQKLHKTWIGVGLVVVMAFILSACGKSVSPPVVGSSSATATTVPAVKVSGKDTLVDGQVVPIRDVTMGFATPGTISEVIVKEGEQVKEGQILARLDGKERIESQIAAAELAVINAKQNIKKLYDAAALQKSNVELDVAQAKIALDDAEKRQRWNNNKASQSTLDQLQSDYILAKKALEDAQDLYDVFKDREDTDTGRASALSALSRAQKNYDRALYNWNYGLGLPDPKYAEKSDAQLAVAKAALDDAQKKLDEVKDGPKPDDLALAQSQLNNSEKQLAAAKSALDDLELKAPFTGTVVTNHMEVGQYGTPGVAAVQIGDLSTMQVETTNLTELDVVDILPGDPVEITFDAVPGLNVTGKVGQVQKVGVNNRGDIDYKVLINLDQQDDRLLWLMSAAVRFLRN